jgi:subtilisin family serine protease
LLAGCALPQDALRAPELPAQARTDPARFVVITVRNDSGPVVATPASTPRGYGGVSLYQVSASARATAHSLERDYRLREVSAWPIESLRVHCIVVRLPDLTLRSALIAQLAHDSRVESVQPLNQFTTETESTASQSSDIHSPPSDKQPYLPLQANLRELEVLQAHKLSQGAAVRIAIIDTGVDYEHPDLQGRIIALSDFVAGHGDFTGDRHGTEVAGVIAATADGGAGVLGVAPKSRLIALKACWPLPRNAAEAACNSFTLAQALQAAISARADIVNLSLAGPPDPLLARLVRYGMQHGIIFVGAVPPVQSGLTDTFPVDIPGVLGVECAEDAAKRASQHLRAPGYGILTLVPGGHYDFASGSSLATAEVSGIVALLLADGRRLPQARVEQILTRSSRQLTTPAGIFTSVDACAAVADALARTGCEVTDPPATQSQEAVKSDNKALRALGPDPRAAIVVAHAGP